MNIFRLLADFSHLIAIFLLLHKIYSSKSCSGISGKTQLLYTLVFTTRYLDLAFVFISVYNMVMKLIFLASSYGTLYLVYVRLRDTYDRDNDTFRIEILILAAAVLALIYNHAFEVVEVLWTFSIYLEAVAILPQLFLMKKTGNAESFTAHYVFALGLYRALYLLNWIYRYYAEDYYDLIVIVAGVVQTVLYCDFFYLYITRDQSLGLENEGYGIVNI